MASRGRSTKMADSIGSAPAYGLQYRSFKDSDGLFDIDWRQRLVGSAPEGEVAHLALDAALVTAVAAGRDAFLENFVEHGIMKSRPVLRGEWPRKPEAFDG
jgi:hypothetical protein